MSGVNRLTNIEVEEVSLVDLAANKRRFLVVKRDSMSGIKKNTAEEMDAAAAAAAAGSETPPPTPPATPAVKEVPSTGGGVLEVSVSALEVLTTLVESLSSLGQSEEANAKLSELAGQLISISQSILEQAGSGAPPAPSEAPPADAPSEEATKAAQFKDGLAQVQALVSQLSSTVTTQKSLVPPEALTQARGDITAAVQKFEAGLAALQSRVSTVEKSFGVPSTHSVERPSATGTLSADVTWPSDLNRLPRENAK